MKYMYMKLRLRGALNAAGITHTKLANDLEKSKRTIYRYLSLSDTAFFSPQALATICQKYRIESAWVLLGEKPMLREKSSADLQKAKDLFRSGLDILDRLWFGSKTHEEEISGPVLVIVRVS